MDRHDFPLSVARLAYGRYSGAVAYIEIRNVSGEVGIGTCFHVGDNVWVTARHVVENRTIVAIDKPRVKGPGSPAVTWQGPFYHPDAQVDVAAFVLSNLEAPVIPLGGHLDDWFGNEFILWPILLMGFPPIPFTQEPILIAATGEVNAVVEHPHGVPHPHFIISTMPRGGFSGGPVLALLPDREFVFGLVTESLGMDNMPLELGYCAVLTVEPILVCLGHHGILPSEDKKLWGDLFDP